MPASQANALIYPSEALSLKVWAPSTASELSPGAGESQHRSPFWAVSQKSTVLWISLLWAQLICKARHFGSLLLRCRSLKLGCLVWGQTLHSSRRGLGFEFPSNFGSLFQGWVLWQDCIPACPTHFDVVFFSFAQCVVIAQPACRYFSEEIFPYLAVDLVCLQEEVSSGSSCVTVLNQNSRFLNGSIMAGPRI